MRPSCHLIVTLPSWFPKYADLAMWQNSPTSTMPVSILMRVKSCSTKRQSLAHSKRSGTHSVRVPHKLLREGRVDDEVAVIRDDGSGLGLGHTQLGLWRPDEVQVLQNLRVRERDDLYGDALFPLRYDCLSALHYTRAHIHRRLTFVPSTSEFLR